MINIDALFPDLDGETRGVLEAAPKSLLEVHTNRGFYEPLKVDDARYVATSRARAEKFQQTFFRTFGYYGDTKPFAPRDNSRPVLFFGHRGCGKSTELNRMCDALKDPERYWVVQVDLAEQIDLNNVRYSDVWLAVVQKLLENVKEARIAPENVVLTGFMNWFSERVVTKETFGELSGELRAELNAQGGIPGLITLLGRLTGLVKAGSTYRDSLRTTVRNSYGDFVRHLNMLIDDLTKKVQKQNLGKEILFIIDGADRFYTDDWRKFFVEDAPQLVQIKSISVYAAPLALKYSKYKLDLFDHIVLPMVKLYEFELPPKKRVDAFNAMRQIILKRCHYGLFESIDVLDCLIHYAGGHLRDMLRLLNYACIEADSDIIGASDVSEATKRLAADYRSWLRVEHYPVLAEFEIHPDNEGTTETIDDLVEGGALLEYNNGSVRRPHPVLALLKPYQTARARLAETSA